MTWKGNEPVCVCVHNMNFTCYDELMVLNLLTQAYYSRVDCGSYLRFQHARLNFLLFTLEVK